MSAASALHVYASALESIIQKYNANRHLTIYSVIAITWSKWSMQAWYESLNLLANISKHLK